MFNLKFEFQFCPLCLEPLEAQVFHQFQDDEAPDEEFQDQLEEGVFELWFSNKSKAELIEQCPSEIVIFGGSILLIRQDIALGHFQIGTQSGGAHLNNPSDGLAFVGEAQVYHW